MEPHTIVYLCLLATSFAFISAKQPWKQYKAEPWKQYKPTEPWKQYKAAEPWKQYKAAEPWKQEDAAQYSNEPWKNPIYNSNRFSNFAQPYYGGHTSNPYYRQPYYQNYYPYNHGHQHPAAPAAPAAPVAPAAYQMTYTPAPLPHVPVAPAPGQVYHGGLVFIGKFEGTCENNADGLYYIDDRSFAYCTGGRKTIQACAGGSANPDYSHFKAGERYQHYEFCSINLAAQFNP